MPRFSDKLIERYSIEELQKSIDADKDVDNPTYALVTEGKAMMIVDGIDTTNKRSLGLSILLVTPEEYEEITDKEYKEWFENKFLFTSKDGTKAFYISEASKNAMERFGIKYIEDLIDKVTIYWELFNSEHCFTTYSGRYTEEEHEMCHNLAACGYKDWIQNIKPRWSEYNGNLNWLVRTGAENV